MYVYISVCILYMYFCLCKNFQYYRNARATCSKDRQIQPPPKKSNGNINHQRLDKIESYLVKFESILHECAQMIRRLLCQLFLPRVLMCEICLPFLSHTQKNNESTILNKSKNDGEITYIMKSFSYRFSSYYCEIMVVNLH